jgi:hypothetical protein
MGFGKFFNKVKSGATKFFSKNGEGSKILGKVSAGFRQVGHLADQVGSSPIVQAIGTAVGSSTGDPTLGSQITNGAKLVSNISKQGQQLTNKSNYAGQDLNQIQSNILERAKNIQSTVNAGPQFV